MTRNMREQCEIKVVSIQGFLVSMLIIVCAPDPNNKYIRVCAPLKSKKLSQSRGKVFSRFLRNE